MTELPLINPMWSVCWVPVEWLKLSDFVKLEIVDQILGNDSPAHLYCYDEWGL
jgi:hypothetical protein